MKRKFKITLKRAMDSVSYVVSYRENELPDSIRIVGDENLFIRPDGNPVNFAHVHQDKLANSVKEQSEEIGAEGIIDDVTGMREFRIRLNGDGYAADFHIVYEAGRDIPIVTLPGNNADVPLPDGTRIPFNTLPPEELKSFVSSMAISNGLNFEFVDLND